MNDGKLRSAGHMISHLPLINCEAITRPPDCPPVCQPSVHSCPSVPIIKVCMYYVCSGDLGRTEDVAYAALFLASDESSYITGQSMIVDGGQTLPESHHITY